MQKNWYNKLSQLTDWAIIIKSPLSHDAHRSIIVLRKMFQKSTLTSTLINFPKMSYWVLCRVSPALLSCLSFRSQIGSRTASYKLQESQAGKLNCGIWTGSTRSGSANIWCSLMGGDGEIWWYLRWYDQWSDKTNIIFTSQIKSEFIAPT